MRVKHKPWAIPMLEEHEDIVIGQPETYRGRWAEVFNNDQDLALEIGTGKGQFIVEMAKRQPKTNFIGLDLQSDVLVMALKKILAEDEALPNLRLLWSNGARRGPIFCSPKYCHHLFEFFGSLAKTPAREKATDSSAFLSSLPTASKAQRCFAI